MKVKCSGVSPCTRCARKKKHCHFPVEEVRVSVSERYLRELEEHISRSGSSGRHGPPAPLDHSPLGGTLFTGDDNIDIPPTPQASSTLLDNQQDIGWRSMSIGMGPPLHTPGTPQREHETQSGAEQDHNRSRFSRNPLVDRDPSFAQTPDGRFWYMGPTSSWSFCRRVLALIGRKVPESNCPPDPFHIDGVAFKLTWRPYPPDEVPDVTNLPPLDYALFLFNTVKFYFGFLSFMIDESAYLQDLHEFYRDPPAKAASNRPWYCQYLLVLAFGKAFLIQRNSSGTPPGHQYASRAMALLPDLSGVDEDPLGCIQALSLGAVYLQSIDMRRAAFQHIGHALRGCIIEGIHRHVPEEICGPELSKRCRTIFWVVYMLDREFSALIGAPSSIRDEDITVKLPAEMDDSVEQINLTLHVRLSRLMATILTTVYGCVVLTTRPLVMCALHMHIERTERQKSQTIGLSSPVASLLQCCADSAQTILQTLRTLADDDLMDAFLPFQVEDASSSAFVLYLIRAIAPSVISNDTWCDNLTLVLDKLISKGNLAAPLRRLELRQLEQILAPLTPKLANHHLPQVNLDESNEINEEEPYAFDHEEFEWDLLGLNSSVSLPPRELLDLADQLDMEGIMQSVGV
ncbi:transcriptional regulator family: Fungal Specific TF [Penicillium sp. CMV-2018d]|nr:transcriptional regulator family: Fungal Specific TF [Penicillium sp. CMV-2018d]